jgi:ribonuclease D
MISLLSAFPIKLREMLEDQKIFKLGVNVIGDAQKLVRENAIYTQGILDLSDIARAVDAENCRPGSAKIALAKLCAQYIGFELDKGAVRTSNWSKKLSQEQMNCKWLMNERNRKC